MSGGMQKRLALARALVTRPELVLFDEPTAGLDPPGRNAVFEMIVRYRKKFDFTAVVVTHDVYESLKIVDHLYFVSEGRVVAEGTPDVVRASADPFVRQFVNGQSDGPVPFHYPALPYRKELFADVQ